MSKRLSSIGLRCSRDERRAVASCKECAWRQEYTGAATQAYAAARLHATNSGHATAVDALHHATYEHDSIARSALSSQSSSTTQLHR